jgi:hypothetical protein
MDRRSFVTSAILLAAFVCVAGGAANALTAIAPPDDIAPENSDIEKVWWRRGWGWHRGWHRGWGWRRHWGWRRRRWGWRRW